jgi:hypothetical protein
MTTQEEARKRMTHSRQEKDHLEDKMRSRSEAELDHPASPHIDEEAREGAVKQHHDQENVQDSMLERSKEEITKKQ